MSRQPGCGGARACGGAVAGCGGGGKTGDKPRAAAAAAAAACCCGVGPAVWCKPAKLAKPRAALWCWRCCWCCRCCCCCWVPQSAAAAPFYSESCCILACPLLADVLPDELPLPGGKLVGMVRDDEKHNFIM